MCGIVGYVGYRNATPLISDGLARLEYRGYDSAGIAVIQEDQIALRREVGKLARLSAKIADAPIAGPVGIGHTRWATHGIPSERNAHPHVSMNGDFVVVHNGIVENYLELRAELIHEGVHFLSETDSEVIAHLVARYAASLPNEKCCDVTAATLQAVSRLRGAHGIVVMNRQQPDRIVAVRIGNAGGVVIGVGDNENFVASDVTALLEETRRVIFLENRQIATISAQHVHIQTLDGCAVEAIIQEIDWDPVRAAKGEYQHFMQKEIFEQARSLTDTLRGRVDFEHDQILLPELHLTTEQARTLKRLVIVACGTSYFSGLVGKFFIEQLARLNVEVDYGSEYRSRNPLLDEQTAVLAITQSGETVDTLAAMEEARTKGAIVWSIVNAVGSQAMRLADGCIAMNAGPEIGVASTKAFTASIAAQLLLALHLGQQRGTLHAADLHRHITSLAHLPDLVGQVLDRAGEIERLAEKVYGYANFLFLGRGIQYPIALEGALKLKEVSYIHAEGYPAGEMKHGPIALIDANLPVLAIVLKDALYEKMISQIEQAKARGAPVIALATDGDAVIGSKADEVLFIPDAPEILRPVLAVIPLQLLAYYVSLRRGTDVDQPRNLAKSVTVE